MSQGINKAILIGRTTEAPNAKTTQNGTTIVNMTLVTNKKVKNEEKAEFHRLVFFNKLADIVNQWVKKGDQLYIEGEIQTKSYEKDGITRYSTEILVNQMNMLGSAKHNTDDKPPSRAADTLPNDDNMIPF